MVPRALCALLAPALICITEAVFTDADTIDKVARIFKESQQAGSHGIGITGCGTWTPFTWPSVSFWSQEVWRRQKVLDVSRPEQVAKLQKFTHQAAYLMCIPAFDPRAGTTWSEPVHHYFLQVAHAPADNFDMPLINKEFREAGPSNISKYGMKASGSCMWWAEMVMCDLAWWSRQLQGTKDYQGDICWHKVQHPGYSYTSQDPLEQIMMPHHAPRGANLLDHPEYTECLDHLVNNTVIDAICPLAGHLPDMAYGEAHWGDGVPLGQAKQEVDECSARLDLARLADVPETDRNMLWDVNMEGIDLLPKAPLAAAPAAETSAGSTADTA